jgi:hypothetical protein
MNWDYLLIYDLRDSRQLWFYTATQHLSVDCISVLSVCYFGFVREDVRAKFRVAFESVYANPK